MLMPPVSNVTPLPMNATGLPLAFRELPEEELGKRVDECVGARNARWMRSYLSRDRLRLVCEFEGPDAESIREAYRSANANFDRVWAAELYQRS